MNPLQPICACQRNATSRANRVKRIHRFHGAAGWALPSLGLVLVPKCPMCIAAWLALGGGVSIATAAYLRTAFVWLCWSALLCMAIAVALRFWPRPLAVPSRSPISASRAERNSQKP